MNATNDIDRPEDNAKAQAVAQMNSITALVAALECDFERLEELRDELAAFVAESPLSDEDAAYKWRAENPDEAAELADLIEAAGDASDFEEAERFIDEDPLSIEVRSGWATPGEDLTPEEFRIVLCTGGPHVELVGDLGQYGTPSRVRCLYRDWGTSGELYDFDHDAALTYAQRFFA